jgi:muramoyltetrapeptide carboxypeptidase
VNKRIFIYSPSGAVRDKAAFRRGVRRLQKLGFEVEVDTDALASHQRFAGDDATRLKAIQRAAASGADVAMISRGGYGLTRILPAIDYAAIAKAIDGGMHFVGLSDFTSLQLALHAKTGAITWAGPSVCEAFGGGVEGDPPDDIMQDCFLDLMSGQGEGTGWRQSATLLPESLRKISETSIEDAVLWGGNLSIVCSLLGTPYFPKIQSGILFLEDVAEHPYRIERMLTQLLYSGVLEQQQAIIFGQFTDYKLSNHDKGFQLKTVIQWLQERIAVPILTNLPFGHVPTKVLLPFGAKVDLTISGRDVLMMWDH